MTSSATTSRCIEKNEDIARRDPRPLSASADRRVPGHEPRAVHADQGAGRQAQNIVAVGDEDQSIYRFRGADINNILNFERDFPGARIIKLEQNYRSTGNILDAATGVVVNNIARKGKTLFTDAGSGEPVRVVTVQQRARRGAVRHREDRPAARGGYKLSDFAVLFRTNAQSRPFEEELLRGNIPVLRRRRREVLRARGDQGRARRFCGWPSGRTTRRRSSA